MDTLNDVIEAQRRYIIEAMAELNLRPAGLARRAKVAPSTITRFLNNESGALSSATMHKIRVAVGKPDPTVILPSASPIPSVTLPVRGKVAAGVWREVHAEEMGVEDSVPVAPIPGYRTDAQYVLLVEGPSVNRKIRDGEYAICVDFAAVPGGYKHGDYVHVERHRAGTVENTIKRVELGDGFVRLVPDSDHPSFQSEIELKHDDEGTEVLIRGIVVGRVDIWRR